MLQHDQRTAAFVGADPRTRGPRSLWGVVASDSDCVLPGTEQVQGDVVLIPDYPAIVPGRDAEEIAWAEDNFSAVCHLDRRMAGDHQAQVLYLAELRAGRGPMCSDHRQPGS